jgi:hypothetical protein
MGEGAAETNEGRVHGDTMHRRHAVKEGAPNGWLTSSSDELRRGHRMESTQLGRDAVGWTSDWWEGAVGRRSDHGDQGRWEVQRNGKGNCMGYCTRGEEIDSL